MFDQIKDATYLQKMELLVPYHREILDSVKKDLKREHIGKDKSAHKQLFKSRPLHRIELEELLTVYSPLLLTREDFGEFVASRWILKNIEIYEFFGKKLEQIEGNFDQLTQLDEAFARSTVQGAIEQFGPRATYFFCVLNSVVLPSGEFRILEELSKSAEPAQISANSENGQGSVFGEQHVRRLEERYRQKLAGLERRYSAEVAALKKHISHLSKKGP